MDANLFCRLIPVIWAAAATWAGAATLALLPGNVEQPVRQQLETALLQQKDLSLVERQELEKLLAEHNFTVTKLTEAGSRVRLGQFVPADLLVFVDGVPHLPRPATRIQIAESKTGIILASQMFDDAALLQRPQDAVDLVQAALGKLAVPLKDRHILGYLDFRGEEAGRGLDDVAGTLGTLVITDLARATNIVVLEREHLEHLRKERELTRLEQDLRTSVRLLEGGVHRTADTNVLAVSVSLRPLAGGEPLLVQLEVRQQDVLTAETATTKKIVGLLKTRRAEWSPVERSREAQIFAHQAALWLAWGDKDRAVRAAEAAFALGPTQTNRLGLAQTLTDELVPQSQWRELNISQHTTLGQALRSRQLLLDYYHLEDVPLPQGATNVVALPHLGYIAGIQFTDESRCPAALKQELRDTEDQLFRRQLQFYQDRYAVAANRYWEAWSTRLQALPFYYEGDPRKQLALVQEAVDAFLREPDPPGPFPGTRLGMLLNVVGELCESTRQYFYPGDLRTLFVQLPALCANRGARAKYEEYCEWLTKQRDPFLRFVGQAGLSRLHRQGKGDECADAGYIASEHAMRRILLDEITCGHRYRGPKPGRTVLPEADYYHDPLFLGTLDTFGTPLFGRDGSQRKAWPAAARAKELEETVALLRDLVAADQVDRIAALFGHSEYDTITIVWLEYLAAHGKLKEAADLTAGLVTMGARCPDWQKPIFGYEWLLKRQQRFKQPIPGPVAKPALPVNGPDWNGYEIQPIDFTWDAEESLWHDPGAWYERGNLHAAADGNRLYCLQPIGGTRLEITIGWLPAGSLIDRFTITCPLLGAGDGMQGSELKGVCSMAVAPDTIYVGAQAGLIRIPLKSKDWTLITPAQGLPGKIVRAVGWYRDRLYLACGFEPMQGTGVGESVFAVYDPRHGSFDILAAEKGVDARNPWKGISFQIDDLVPDEPHECLWLRDHERGLWKFIPATRAFEQIVAPPPQVIISQTRQAGNVNSFGQPPIRLVHLPDLAHTDLPGGLPGFRFNTQTYNATYDGDAVIATAQTFFETGSVRLLFLQKPGQPPARLFRTADGQPFPGTLLLQETGAGIVAFTVNGGAYLISRKARAAEVRRAELQAVSGDARETQLLDAAEAGQLPELERWLAAGVNINAPDQRGWTPLHYAIDRHRTETALLLLQRGADLNRATAAGHTPLAFAAKRNEVPVVKELLARRVPVDAVAREDGATPLTCAARAGATEAAALLIAAGADVNHRGAFRHEPTVLIEAATRGQLPMVQFLAQNRAKLELADNHGDTALAYAARVGQTNALAGLVQLGAELNSVNSYGWTPLIQAVKANQLESVRSLADAGADLNYLGHGRTALMVAVRDATIEIVQCLVDHGAKVGIARGEWTALRYAELEKHQEMVAILRKALEAEKQGRKP